VICMTVTYSETRRRGSVGHITRAKGLEKSDKCNMGMRMTMITTWGVVLSQQTFHQ